MRQATVTADHSLAVHEVIGSERVIGYLTNGERVTILGGPENRLRQWWHVRTERQFSGGSPNIIGWVAGGDGAHMWLAVDPVEVRKPTDFEPVELPVALSPWWWVGLVIAAVIAIAVWFMR